MKNGQEKLMCIQWRALSLSVILTMGSTAAALAQGVIRSISTTQQGTTDVVRVEMSEALSQVPSGFAIQVPPRIAIDLPGVGSALQRSVIEINQGNLRTVNVAQGDGRTRLVLNLKQAAAFKAQLDGKALLLMVDSGGAISAASASPAPTATPSAAPAAAAIPATAAASPSTTAAAAPAPAAPTHFAPSLNRESLALREIDFRRGAGGAGRVIVSLPNNQVGVDMRQQGQTLIVEFLRSTLPESLRKRLDVSDFGTPVHTVTTQAVGDRVRMVVEPRGNWEHSAYQSDNQFVLEVRPVAVDPNKLTQGPGYAGEKLSLNFQNIEVRALLQVIADFTNFNIITSDTVTGNVTLRLKDVPWDQALDIILQSKGLGMRKSNNVILVAPKDELVAKEQLELEAKKKFSDLEPLRTQFFQLNYSKADDILKALMGQSAGQTGGGNATRMLSARGSALSEPRTNQLFITDIPSKLEEVQSMITRIDVPVRQVLIEARIVEADDKFGRALGVKLGGNDLRALDGRAPGYTVGGGNRITIGGNYAGVGSQTLQSPTANYSDTQFVSLPANVSALGGSAAATFALSLFSATANRFLNLELSALEADGKGKIVSSPRVITADQVKALIEQGEELPYQTATSSGATAIQFRKANLKLEVTPQITPEGNVILDVTVNKDSVGRVTAAGFAIDTKHIKTQVLVENGGTVVIGGIYTQTERNDVNKVPLLGDIPYVGNLFKNTVRSANKTELLVFITPKVITDRNSAR